MRTATPFRRMMARLWASMPVIGSINRRLDRLERLSHGGRATYVGNNRVLTRCVVGGGVIGFLVEADDRLLSPSLILTGEYEVPLTNYFLSHLRADSHCLDVGANFGYFTCLMGRKCPHGKVLGIEPDRHVFELARDNIHINGLQSHATVRQAAVCDRDDRITLHRRITRSGNTSIQRVSDDFIEWMGEPKPTSFEVDSLRIDSLLPHFDQRIDFIKIDVEGAEPLALRGARRTIAANPQVRIILEWSPGQIHAAGFDVTAFVAELGAMGLQIADIDIEGSERPLSGKELLRMDYRPGILLTTAR
jgi:FkbM family methyltransferase